MNTHPPIERVILVHIDFPSERMLEDLDEFQELARSAGAAIVSVITGKRSAPAAKYFVGTGKAEEIRAAVLASGVKLVIFNHALSPAQERNLERLLQCRVLDRTGLILDIFALRARSFEGKLQVELALLNHLATRLVRGWTHLERQRGGIGLRGGPGETQLEVDRRLIRNRIKVIKQKLVKIRKQRDQGRRARKKATIPTVALVGYTNAGKSTLFNVLTGAEVYVANQLFATLDPTLRRVEFPQIGTIIFADTVGFIRHLPTDLVEAFKATLEEVSEADLLLHVIDVYDDNKEKHMEQVNSVLKNIGAEAVPQLLVYNKMDLVPDLAAHVDRADHGKLKRIYVSAKNKQGLAELIAVMGESLGNEIIEKDLLLRPKETALRAKLYQRGAVLSETIDDEGNYQLRVRLPKREIEKLF